MRREDFTYELPNELIARHPAKERRESRLLCVDGPSGSASHENFVDLLDKVQAGDLMVFNDTRVIPARVFGRKASGGKIEILVERVLSAHTVLAHVKASKAPKPGSQLILENGTEIEVDSRRDALFVLNFLGEREVIDVLEAVGHMPLPPYIDREDELEDQSRYQTVYADKKGAVAAPTAGLHFDDAMLEALKKKGVQIGFVTLHVGAGTFQPVRVDDIKQHQMHSEVINVDQALCDAVIETKARGGRVIAVGTTSVRCLESIASFSETGELQVEPYVGETDIFIYPGYDFKLVDCLITNFHLPESTLLMLVSAFIGYETTLRAYNSAVEQKYRFFSYGDAMYLSRNPDAASQGPRLET